MTRGAYATAVAIGSALVACAASARAEEAPASPELHVRGAILAIDARYVVFATGDAIRLRAGTAVPKGATIGSMVLVTIDRSERAIDAIVLDAHASDEIAIADILRPFVVASAASARSAPEPVRAGASAIGGAGDAPTRAIANVTIVVTIPTNTAPGDDVYLSTDRSNYSPSELRMQRVDARHFTATVALDASGKLKYQFTRGTYATVERDRSGGIVAPHLADGTTAKIDDTVTRWADSN